MRRDAAATLGSTCNVVTVARERDARGNVTEYAVTGPDFACHVAPRTLESSSEQVIAGAMTASTTYRLHHPTDVVVDTNDRVIVTVAGQTRMLEVVGVRSVLTYAPLHAVTAMEVDR
jgi:hypothetical protein